MIVHRTRVLSENCRAPLLAAISSVIETIGVRAPDHDGLTCGVDRFTGGDNDFIGDETLLIGCTNGLIAGEKDFTGEETVRAGRENRVTAGENDLTDGENRVTAGENDLMAGENDLRAGDNDLMA